MQPAQAKFLLQPPAGAIRELDRIKHVAAYPPGAVIFVQGQAARGVFIVCEGQVKLVSNTQHGNALILKFAGSGDILGLPSVITGTSYGHRAETIRAAQLAFVAAEDFLAFLKENRDALSRVPKI
jgi:CRP/FNR family cyclic AMP-dependent transcriptional regulator